MLELLFIGRRHHEPAHEEEQIDREIAVRNDRAKRPGEMADQHDEGRDAAQPVQGSVALRRHGATMAQIGLPIYGQIAVRRYFPPGPWPKYLKKSLPGESTTVVLLPGKASW